MSGRLGQLRGITDDQIISPDTVGVDVRPLRRRVSDWMHNRDNVFMLLLMMGGGVWYYREVGVWVVFVSLGIFAWAMGQNETAPLKIPAQANLPDRNQPHPATKKPTTGKGIFFLGNELKNNKEIWLTNDDCRQHFLVLGTTGAGKALSLKARVHTPNGWRRMGELSVGDEVTTPQGGSARIVGYYPQGRLPMCRLTFADGRRADSACPDHLWEVFIFNDNMTPSSAEPEYMWHHRKVVRTSELAVIVREANTRVFFRLPEPVRQSCGSNGQQDPAVPGNILEAGLSERVNFVHVAFDRSGFLDEFNRELIIGEPDLGQAKILQEVIWSLGGIAEIRGGDESVSSPVELVVRHRNLDWIAGRPTDLNDRHGNLDNQFIELSSVDVFCGADEAACILIDDDKHLYITGDYVPTHNTEALLGFGANALSWGSGFLFCDGKGDVSVFAKVYAMARRFGREDDLLVLNFMTGNRDAGSSEKTILSNTLNPFSTGSSDNLTQMVVSLMDEVGGDGAMWKGRATAMLTGVMRALCWLRDQGYLDLNVSEINDHMALPKIMELASEKKYPDMPPHIRRSIRSYLTSLPGYQEEKGDKQAQTTLDQHGYLQMQFTKITGNLGEVYGHIFATPYGEVDMFDVALNRRILFVMLPALEKSGDEIANLGKIVVATLKGMMGSTLGPKLEGTYDEIVKRRPTNSPSPFLCILDEVGYYTVDGMALMAAQARSLGFGLVFASQDIPAMKRKNEKEAASIIANTNTKIFMRTEEPNETARLAIDRGDKALRVRVSGFDRKFGELAGKHAIEGDGANYEEASRINLTDLARQSEGEMHVVYKDSIIRAQSFYANPEGSVDETALKLRANHFIRVPKPRQDDLIANINGPEIMARLCNPSTPESLKKAAEELLSAMEGAEANEISLISKTMDAIARGGRKPIEAACGAIAYIVQSINGSTNTFVSDVAGRNGVGMMDVDDDMEDSYGGFDDRSGRQDGRRGSQTTRSPFVANTEEEIIGNGYQPDRGPRRPYRVDKTVPHGTVINRTSIVDMANKIASNDAIMSSLASLNFDDDGATQEEINQRFSQTSGHAVASPEMRDELRNIVESFDRSSQTVLGDHGAGGQPEKKGHDGSGRTDDVNNKANGHTAAESHGEPEDEGGEEGGESGEFVSDFLEGLLRDSDHDE